MEDEELFTPDDAAGQGDGAGLDDGGPEGEPDAGWEQEQEALELVTEALETGAMGAEIPTESDLVAQAEEGKPSEGRQLDPNAKYLTKRDYVGFALALSGGALVSGLMGGYLLAYCMTQIEAPYNAFLSILFLIVKIWDGVNDPILGVLIDRTHTRWGKLRPYVMFASIPFGLLTIAMFFIPQGIHPIGKLVWIFVIYIVWDVLSTLVDVPMQGLYAVVTPNSDERAKIITSSRFFSSIAEQGALVVTTVLFFLADYNVVNAQWVYSIAAVLLGSVCGVVMFCAVYFLIRERLVVKQDPPKLTDAFKYLFKNKPFLIMVLANLLTFFRNLVSACIIYVVACIFAAPGKQIVYSLPGGIASMIGMLAAPYLKKRFDAKTIFILATVAHSIGLAVVFAVGYPMIRAGQLDAAFWTVAVLMFVAMLPVGLLNTVPHLMAADCIDYMEWKTGTRAEGLAFSIMTLRSKVSSGFKDATLVLLLVVIFQFNGYGAEGNLFPEQSQYTKTGIFLTYSLIPAVLNLVSIIPMFFYKLNGAKMKEIAAELAERRKTTMQIVE